MEEGWIHLHRKITKWEWYDDHNTTRLFIHLLLTVNWEDKKWRGTVVERGSLITSYTNLAKSCGLSVRGVRTSLTKLKLTNEVTIKTTNKYTMVIINKYDDYDTSDKQDDKRKTNKRQTNDKQMTTTKEYKNISIKELKNNTSIAETSSAMTIEQPSKEIALILELFVKLNPTISYGNKTQRNAISCLVEKMGFEKTLAAAQYALSISGDQYAPRISTPLELKNKLGQLILYKQKENSNSSFNKIS